MLKRNDPFALPDLSKSNDNNAKINVREAKLLRESSIKHPRDLLRVNGEDLLETIGVDKRFSEGVEKIGIWTEEEVKKCKEKRGRRRERKGKWREKKSTEKKGEVSRGDRREEMILEKKRMKQAERQRRKKRKEKKKKR